MFCGTVNFMRLLSIITLIFVKACSQNVIDKTTTPQKQKMKY